MAEPDRDTKLEARVLAAYARKQVQQRWDKLNKSRPPDKQLSPLPEDYQYGFTIVCNNCGSMNGTHGMWSRRDDYGYYVKCPDCEQRIRY